MMQSKEMLTHSSKTETTFCLIVKMYQMTILFVLKAYLAFQYFLAFSNTGKDYLWLQNPIGYVELFSVPTKIFVPSHCYI